MNIDVHACHGCGAPTRYYLCGACRESQLDDRETRHVYVIECGGRIKIGISVNPNERAQQIEIVSPFKIESVWFTMLTRYARRIEALAHAHFDAERVHGEWFTTKAHFAVDFIARKLVELISAREQK